MKPAAQAPIRELANFLIHQIKASTECVQLEVIKEMLDTRLLERYIDNPLLAHEYARVDLELRRKEEEFGSGCAQVNIMDLCAH